jgi:phenylacetate-CoA ligase
MHAGAASDAQIWDQAETLPPPQLQALQLDRLRATVKRILDGQPFAAQRLTAAGLDAPEQLTSLGDLARLPFTSKADLRARYPFGLLAVGRDQLVRVHASSGTHGKPTVVGYTRADLENWTELMARCMTMAGVRPGMTLHNANGYGLFTGGLGFHQGGERIGATVVPVSGGFTARQLLLLHDLGARAARARPRAYWTAARADGPAAALTRRSR